MLYQYKNIAKIGIALAFGLLPFGMNAQTASNPMQIKGQVLGSDNQPIAGATITSTNKRNTAITDIDGRYKITVNDGSKYLTINYVGSPSRTIDVNTALKNGDVKLEDEAAVLDQMVAIGYQTISRRELTGATASVSGTTLDRSAETHLGKSLAGQLSGLTIIENNGEPGRPASSSSANGISMLLRGQSTINGTKPLIIIDGQVSPDFNYMYITPEEIESVTVLKDAALTAIYGIQSGNGAIIITTKRGKVGKTAITVYADEAMQEATHTPLFVNSYDYARMRNQAGVNDGKGVFSQFSEQDTNLFATGDELHQNNDWYNLYTNKRIWMTRAGMSLTGGTERLRYYANMNYMHESSPFKTEKNAKYDPEPATNRFNFRSNIDVSITSYLKAFMGISGTINNVKTAGEINGDVYSSLFALPPTMWGPTTPLTDKDGNILNNGGQVITIDGVNNPTYGILNRSGYRQILKADIMAQGGLTFDLDMVTPGLSLTGVVGYETSATNQTNTLQDYQSWVRTNDLTTLDFTRLGAVENTPLSYSKTRKMFYNINLSAFANYRRSFGNHFINAQGYVSYQNRETETLTGADMLPYYRETFGINATYGFMNRYYVRGDFGYAGSEQFHPDHRWTPTPAVSGTWILSEEEFMRGLNPWLSLAKLRASYGITANDQLDDARMLYSDYVDYQGNEGMRGNPLLAPEKIRKQNYGIDLGFFNNELQISFDWFKNNCDNLLIQSSKLIPIYQGVPLDYYPMINAGKIENKGYEISANWTKNLGRDFTITLGGSFSHAKNTILDVKEVARDGYAYPYEMKGQSIGQKWGYLIDYSNGNGYYNFQDEIKGSGLTYSFGTPRLGDFRYKDLNNDGTIDAKDRMPIGYSHVPQNYYAFNGGFNWKGFEVNVLFQGVSKRSVALSGVGAYEYMNQGVFSDIHMNAWTPERWINGEEISYPALSLAKSTSHVDNSFFIMDGSYLRLKNAEIAYTLPKAAGKFMKAQSIRISLRGQNLFTIDHLRTKHIDPEIGDLNAFPTYRSFDLGVKVTF